MQNRFYLLVMLISAIALFVFSLLAAYREISPEWKKYQMQYKEELVKKTKDEALIDKAKALPVEVKQIYLSSLNRVDRCISCHAGIENPLMANEKPPLKQHSGNYLKKHPLDKFGCTICHYGQGRATNVKEAHGKSRDTHWDFPVIPLKYIQSACVQCHDLGTLKANGADNIVKGERLFREKGCRGCHKLNGIGGVLGKPLDIVGSQPIAYFPMKNISGEKNTYSWMKQHFIDPRNLVPESEMKVSVTDEEADFLTTYVLSLRAGEAPKSYRRIKMTEDEKPADEGEALYRMYCIACHANGKDSIFDEIFNRTIPAIMNPSLLKSADDRYLNKILEEGREGTQMTAWKASAAGLSEYEINKITEYITRERPLGKIEKFDFTRFKPEVKKGEELFKVRCALCHGKKGEGELGVNLRNPVVQGADPEFLAVTVRDGREETPMPPFGKKGVGLSDQDIADIVSFVKTLSQKK